jgi:hypothetical protein
MASAMARRSLGGSCAQTGGLFRSWFCMVGPPDWGFSLKDRNQFRNGSRGQDGWFGTRFT